MENRVFRIRLSDQEPAAEFRLGVFLDSDGEAEAATAIAGDESLLARQIVRAIDKTPALCEAFTAIMLENNFNNNYN
ncbi:hypothetical protein VB796_21140 [Arcicella sp. LKC2W]|uniref:hypothetical protein n=1 Tax=Arcicella sp. LKC2W TaxID=2984198 RepID=UPI002B1F36D0|nr:hypothetical protein [Arcicella sp. LKC2W]MEA5461586.1 hypothetical protein [Arcicella sp. LKC2W]